MRRAASWVVPLSCALTLLSMRAVGEPAVGGRRGRERHVNHSVAQPNRPPFQLAFLFLVKLENPPYHDSTERSIAHQLVRGLRAFADSHMVYVDTSEETRLKRKCERIRVTMSCDVVRVTQKVDEGLQAIVAMGELEHVRSVRHTEPLTEIPFRKCSLGPTKRPSLWYWRDCRSKLFDDINVWVRDYAVLVRDRNRGGP